MDITPFIRELLFGHDCVIIPGFGGFIANYRPAYIEKTTGIFNPPVKQISFNRNLNHNDGLLTGKVSEAIGMNYSDTRNIIELWTEDLKMRLSKGERVVFDHIGIFVNNHEGNVQFEPDANANFSLNSYGLSSFPVSPLKDFDVRKRILPGNSKETGTRVSLSRYIWRAAVIIPLLGLMIAVPLSTNLFKSNVQSTNMNPLASVELESNRAASEKNKTSETPVTGNQANLAIPGNDVKNEVKNSVDELYAVVAGSFRSEDNASLLVKKLSEEGFTPVVAKGPNGFFRVSALQCVSLETALNKKDSISKKYPGSWISKVK